MEGNLLEQKKLIYDCKQIAMQLIINEERSIYEVINILKERGLDEETATTIVDNIEKWQAKQNRKVGIKNMIWGAIWLILGLGGTFANIGFIFYGAIISGIIQCYVGFERYNRS